MNNKSTYKITKSYSGIEPTLNELDWEENDSFSLIFFSNFETINNKIKSLGFITKGNICSHSLNMGFDITIQKQVLFKLPKKSKSSIVLSIVEDENTIGKLTCINLDEKPLNELITFCDDSIRNKYKNHRCFGISGGMGGASITLKEPISKPDKINFHIDYGYNFNKINDRIVELLSIRNNQLLIFEGNPGTGKTSYIKHLYNTINKNFLFTGTGMFNYMNEDVLIRFTQLCGPLIIVIEDSETLVTERRFNPQLSKLLNLIDGVHKDKLNISFILTWNAADAEIDPALKRKGRLSYKHKFDLLPPELANAKAAELNILKKWTEPTSLAEIYNAFEDQGFQEQQKKMGF